MATGVTLKLRKLPHTTGHRVFATPDRQERMLRARNRDVVIEKKRGMERWRVRAIFGGIVLGRGRSRRAAIRAALRWRPGGGDASR